MTLLTVLAFALFWRPSDCVGGLCPVVMLFEDICIYRHIFVCMDRSIYVEPSALCSEAVSWP